MENGSDLAYRISQLPSGGLTTKRIKGREYTYYQWSASGKQHARSVKGEELENLRRQIQERKLLEAKLLEVRNGEESPIPCYDGISVSERAFPFRTNIRTGKRLEAFASVVRSYEKRECYAQIERYLYDERMHDKVLILYGLRRTGKTTLIRQAICAMKEKDRAKAAFVQVTTGQTMADINRDLVKLEDMGYKYVFIDEITLMDDFIEGAALLSDIYASTGMRIVLSGTDSLGFNLARFNQLYDRCILVHTTFIPFREFERLLGIHDIDTYLQFGGTLSRSGDNYNESVFSNKRSADEYVNISIAHNIQHSLKNYQNEGHFRSLWQLYEKSELTNVIHRIVEDMNHRFTTKVLTQDFKSHDLGSAKNILRKDRENPTDILDRINSEEVTANLMRMLEILNEKDTEIDLNDVHCREIREYLAMLDLTCDIPLVDMSNLNTRSSITVFSQMGLRYCQAESLVKALMMDDAFRALGSSERNAIIEKCMNDIRGRMLEELVLLETLKAEPKKQVFKLQFAIGEFDMVVYDEKADTCCIYEIKHSGSVDAMQYRFLVDDALCSQTENRYGKILEKVVLYRGQNRDLENEVKYRNVQEYLLGL